VLEAVEQQPNRQGQDHDHDEHRDSRAYLGLRMGMGFRHRIHLPQAGPHGCGHTLKAAFLGDQGLDAETWCEYITMEMYCQANRRAEIPGSDRAIPIRCVSACDLPSGA
jgi:hypothetical protein